MTTITVTAAVNKVQTLADGGIRWTFDLPETAVLESAHLMEIKRNGVPVEMTLVPAVVKESEKEYGGRLK
jgi:hypothetical protein